MTAWPRTRQPRELTPSEAYELDYRIAELTQHINQRRLALGDALHWLHQHGGALKLGFSGIDVYGHEIIQERKRWCEDSRRLAKRLRELPIIRAALVGGTLGWSMAELLARHATPETEEALVTTARMKPVREMRARLQPERPHDVPAERVTICASVPRTDAWYFESTRMLVAAIIENASNDDFVEAALAETMTRLAELGVELPDTSELDNRFAELRAQMSAKAAEREAEADGSRPPPRVFPNLLPSPDLPTDPLAVHETIVDGLLLYTSDDLELALALRRLDAGRPWHALGFDSLAHYARERLGMSEQSARNRIQLAYAVSDMPALGHALREGRVGLEAARLIGRIASPGTVDAWIERASERTLKHLREEVEAAGLLESLTNDRTFELPPDDEALETVNDLERAVLAGVVGAPQMSDSPCEALDEPTVMLKIPMREDLARFWRALEQTYASLAADMPFVTFACRCVWESWRDSEARMASYAYLDVYLRERFRCASPVCSRRDVTAHHVVFRAHGGGEERENLSAICSTCHLEGVHQSNLRVAGLAPARLTWSLVGGRLRVEGRRTIRQRASTRSSEMLTWSKVAAPPVPA